MRVGAGRLMSVAVTVVTAVVFSGTLNVAVVPPPLEVITGAVGGASYPQTGSRGDGYRIAARLGHRVVTPRPALVPVTCRERFFRRLVPAGDPIFEHVSEGPDDMPAHVRAALTTTTLSIPVLERRPALGTWQGIYLYEHRARPHRRSIAAHLLGE